jgi:hypothetical protein
MLPEFELPSEEKCPVSDELLGVLYRSNPHGLSALVTSVGSATRAMLALYCYRRAHLQDIGLSIAATCEEANLLSLGAVGAILFSRSREAPHESIVNYHQATNGNLIYWPSQSVPELLEAYTRARSAR